jgi:tetratricopeptide (TPR) repeat protein
VAPDSSAAPLIEGSAAPVIPAEVQRETQVELERAHDLLAAGKLERAITVLEESLRSHPDAEVATALGELRTIRRSSKRLQRRPRDPYAHYELGRALFAQECGPQALKHLEQACRLRPSWLDAHLLRAYELHWEGRWREAEAAYQTVLAIDPIHQIARRGLTAVRAYQSPDALMGDGDLPGQYLSSAAN